MKRVMGILLGASLVFSLSAGLWGEAKSKKGPVVRHGLALTLVLDSMQMRGDRPLNIFGFTVLGLWGVFKAEKDWDLCFSIAELGSGILRLIKLIGDSE